MKNNWRIILSWKQRRQVADPSEYGNYLEQFLEPRAVKGLKRCLTEEGRMELNRIIWWYDKIADEENENLMEVLQGLSHYFPIETVEDLVEYLLAYQRALRGVAKSEDITRLKHIIRELSRQRNEHLQQRF